MKLAHWQYNILKLLGINPFDVKRSKDALSGHSKHGRAKMALPGYQAKRKAEAKRKAARKLAADNRKRNRR